jgi:hypothetical protein
MRLTSVENDECHAWHEDHQEPKAVILGVAQPGPPDWL